jgi:eukaryotic-like serine/threonine-protein kinase
MLKQAFCGICVRSVYLHADEDDACPVCSSSLVVTGPDVEIETSRATPGPLIPSDEDLRITAVNRYDILDTPPDGAFDRITRLAARIFNVPISTISIVDHDRIWFKSKYGITAEEIDREPGLCASAVLHYDPWIVEDASVDPRALENELVRGELGLRFYAGVPLKTADGYNLGTLTIIDTEPRTLTDDELDILKQLGELVVDEMELRLAALRVFREAAEKAEPLDA